MAILFDWYENPKPSDKEQGEKTLHPRLKYNGSIGTDVLSRRIQERCSLTETDVTAVLDALSHIMGQELANGRQVHLDGIGYFRPCLTSTEPVTIDTKRKATKVKLKAIQFRADQTLKNFQDLCRMTRSTAMRHIRRLRDEGKLKNEGGVMQPIYVPGNGYYTNNKHVTD